MLCRSAPVLGPLIAEIAVVGRRVGNVPRPGVVNHGFADLNEAGGEPVDEHQDEDETHDGPILVERRSSSKSQ